MLRWGNESADETRLSQDYVINGQLLDHQARSDWAYAPVSQELQLWLLRIVDRFNLRIGEPALCFLKLRGACGHYRLNRNGFGLNHEIAIDTGHLNRGLQSIEGWIEVLRTLTHECIHHYEHVQCGRTKGGRYHTVVFRKKAEQIGLLVDERGYSLGIVPNSPFTKLLDEYGVGVPKLDPVKKKPAETAPTKLKLWECQCDLPFKLRIARPEPRIRCEYCGQLFQQRGA